MLRFCQTPSSLEANFVGLQLCEFHLTGFASSQEYLLAMKLDCFSQSSGHYQLSDVASSLVFAVVHAVISMVVVVAVGIVGFGYDNYGLVADYTVD